MDSLSKTAVVYLDHSYHFSGKNKMQSDPSLISRSSPVANLISTNLPPISSPCSRLQKDISATRIGDEVVQADFIVTKEVDRASQEVDRASQEVHIETREVHKNAQATVTKQPENKKVKTKPAKGKQKDLGQQQAFNDQKFKDNITVVENSEGGIVYLCKLCQKNIYLSRKARTHAIKCELGKNKKKKSSKKQHHCTAENCEEIFSSKKLLTSHFNQTHPTNRFSCSRCGKKIKLGQNYLRHIKLHNEKPIISCEVCKKSYSNQFNLKRHIENEHSRSAIARSILKELIVNIVKDKKVVAEKNVNKDGGLDEEGIHLIPDNGPRGDSFACNECGKTCRDQFNLDRHIKAFHSNSNTDTICPHPFCTKTFSDKFMMIQHKKECFLNCPWENCSMKFTRPKLFQRHQKSHETRLRRLL